MNTLSRHSIAMASWAAASLGAGSLAAQSLPVSAPAASTAPQGTDSKLLERQLGSLLNRAGGLTADQVAARARSLSYEAQARRADSVAAQQQVVQAELGFVPRVAARGTYTRVSDVGVQSLGPLGFSYPVDNFSLQVDVVFPISDYLLRIAKQYTSARHSAKATELMANATELTASSNARIEYYAWARARLQELVALSALDVATEHLADAKSSLAAGQASPADVMQVEAQRADRELQVARTRSAVTIEAERLRTMLHDPPRASYEIGEPLLVPLTQLPRQNDFPALLDEAWRRRPELQALQQTVAGLRDEASQQKIGLLPRLDAFGSAQYANPNSRYFPPVVAWKGTWALGAMVSWTSADAILGGTRANAYEAQATGANARANVVRDGIRDEVMQAFSAVHDAELAIETTARSSSAAEEAYRVRRALFRAAQATSTELSETETALTQARFAAIDACIELRIARVRLLHATGREMRGP